MFGLSPLKLLIILVIILLLFGVRRLPELGRGIGEGIRNLKRGLSDASKRPRREGADDEDHEPEAPRRPRGRQLGPGAEASPDERRESAGDESRRSRRRRVLDDDEPA